MSPALLAQYLLPHKTLSRIVRAATRWTWRPWKDFLIRRVVSAYRVDMTEAAQPDAFAYPNFNAFFTRALCEGARQADPDGDAILSPADGCISQIGQVREGRLLQAKGRTYSVAELLADADAAEKYRDAFFATIYLSPRDYHRVHMPLDGELIETVHVPGRLFSVAPDPVAGIPNLFARNERLVCHFEGARGAFVVAMVGAMLVSGITTVWSGKVVPAYARAIVRRDWRGRGIRLARFAEMARFEMGSTVIVLVPAARCDPQCRSESPVTLGQRLGHLWRTADQGTIGGSGEASNSA
ncbi:MAG TPA: archaetidylserine decarboxylase [Rhodanobacteraceae bacterium]|jgi:phosphatidylserine decarboxylase|nr:archaetidylserine decarboxylase [Rhodanobacteraceae bacterium]